MNRPSFTDREGAALLPAMVDVIAENRQHLSDIDGLIGDGDHGVNMHKGFDLFRRRFADLTEPGLSESLQMLGTVLMDEIGGSMGPLYGSIFRAMARACRGKDAIDADVFRDMLAQAEQKVRDIGECREGDKTVLDVLAPARRAFEAALPKGFAAALEAMNRAADEGRESTVDMVARKGRSSRLGERSRGVPDAGATSCCLLLTAMSRVAAGLLAQEGCA